MLTYTLSRADSKSLYEQLYERIREDIRTGVVKPDERLPSKRTLAQHLRVSVITVENAYAQLIDEGYVTAREKRGYFAIPFESTTAPIAFSPSVPGEPPAFDWFLDFSGGGTCAEGFPFSVWAKIMRGVLQEKDKKLLEPLAHNGVYELREAIAAHLYRFRGLSVDPSRIVIGAGTEYLYNILVQLLGRDKVYAVENPGHKKIAQIYGLNEVKVVPVPVDAEGLSAAALRLTDAEVVHISPAHNFPTGTIMSVSRRQSLLAWAGEQDGRYILEDDYDSEFRFSGLPIPSLFSADSAEKVIYINTFSRTIAPSIRISYMILPPHLQNDYEDRLSFYSCTVPAFEQYALARFIGGGFFEKHINRMKKQYRQERDAVVAAIKESPLAPYVTVGEEKAGLHFLMKINTELSDEAIRRRAKDNGIRLVFLSDYAFLPDSAYDHVLVIHFAGIDMKKLPEALKLISSIIINI